MYICKRSTIILRMRKRFEVCDLYMAGDLCAVIDMLKDDDKHEYDVIKFLGVSYFSIGDFMESYKILHILFETDEYIHRLPPDGRSNPELILYKIYRELKGFDVEALVNKFEKDKTYPPHPVEITLMDGTKAKIIRSEEQIQRGNGYFLKARDIYMTKEELSMYDCFTGLVLLEMACGLVYKIPSDFYYLKSMFIEKINNGFYYIDSDLSQRFEMGKLALILKGKSVEKDKLN